MYSNSALNVTAPERGLNMRDPTDLCVTEDDGSRQLGDILTFVSPYSHGSYEYQGLGP